MSILPDGPRKSSQPPPPDSTPAIDADRAAEALRRAIEAHQRHDLARHIEAKRSLIGMGIGITFAGLAGWEAASNA